MKMPPMKEPLAVYLSQGEASSLKAPALPSKLCQILSQLVEKAMGQWARAVVLCTSWRCCRHTRLTCSGT